MAAPPHQMGVRTLVEKILRDAEGAGGNDEQDGSGDFDRSASTVLLGSGKALLSKVLSRECIHETVSDIADEVCETAVDKGASEIDLSQLKENVQGEILSAIMKNNDGGAGYSLKQQVEIAENFATAFHDGAKDFLKPYKRRKGKTARTEEDVSVTGGSVVSPPLGAKDAAASHDDADAPARQKRRKGAGPKPKKSTTTTTTGVADDKKSAVLAMPSQEALMTSGGDTGLLDPPPSQGIFPLPPPMGMRSTAGGLMPPPSNGMLPPPNFGIGNSGGFAMPSAPPAGFQEWLAAGGPQAMGMGPNTGMGNSNGLFLFPPPPPLQNGPSPPPQKEQQNWSRFVVVEHLNPTKVSTEAPQPIAAQPTESAAEAIDKEDSEVVRAMANLETALFSEVNEMLQGSPDYPKPWRVYVMKMEDLRVLSLQGSAGDSLPPASTFGPYAAIISLRHHMMSRDLVTQQRTFLSQTQATCRLATEKEVEGYKAFFKKFVDAAAGRLKNAESITERKIQLFELLEAKKNSLEEEINNIEAKLVNVRQMLEIQPESPDYKNQELELVDRKLTLGSEAQKLKVQLEEKQKLTERTSSDASVTNPYSVIYLRGSSEPVSDARIVQLFKVVFPNTKPIHLWRDGSSNDIAVGMSHSGQVLQILAFVEPVDFEAFGFRFAHGGEKKPQQQQQHGQPYHHHHHHHRQHHQHQGYHQQTNQYATQPQQQPAAQVHVPVPVPNPPPQSC